VSFAGLLAGAAYYLATQSDHVTVQRRVGSILQVNLVQQTSSASRADSIPKTELSVAVGQSSSVVDAPKPIIETTPAAAAQSLAAKQIDSKSSAEAPSSPQAMMAPIGQSADIVAANSSFQRELLAHIAAYRRYPDAARAERLTGVVNVRFALDRDGMVLDAWVQKSSGYQSLDQEAIETIRRAQPMPSIPLSMPGRVDLVMPVAFALL
jgi:protein TonB